MFELKLSFGLLMGFILVTIILIIVYYVLLKRSYKKDNCSNNENIAKGDKDEINK